MRKTKNPDRLIEHLAYKVGKTSGRRVEELQFNVAVVLSHLHAEGYGVPAPDVSKYAKKRGWE